MGQMPMKQPQSRRDFLCFAAAMAAIAGAPTWAADSEAGTNMTGRLAAYMAAVRQRSLPAEVLTLCKHRVLDTFAAMLSGSRMKPGELATAYVRGLGGIEQATVIGSGFRTTVVNAAFANAMCAHADETDDFEPVTKAHPGSCVVPAALAMAEKEHCSGEEFVRAVVLGYDLACRLLMALGPDLVR